MGCTSEGARRAANQVYRRIASTDSSDLSAPLPKDNAIATLNGGLQPNDGTTLIISPVFNLNTGNVDLVLVNWAHAEGGALVALSRRTIAQIVATAEIDGDGHFYGEEVIVPCNTPFFELRAIGLTDVVEKLRAWSY